MFHFKKNTIYVFLVSFCMMIAPVASAFLLTQSKDKMVELLVVDIVCLAIIIVEYLFRREKNPNCIGEVMDIRLYLGSMSVLTVLVSTYPFMSSMAWPYMFVALWLCFMVDQRLAIGSYTILLVIPCIIGDISVNYLFLYLLIGLVIQMLFGRLDDSYKVGIPLFISFCIFLVLSVANVLLYRYDSLDVETFILPFVNVFVNLILMIIILKIYSSKFLHRYRDRYLTINDTEFSLLTEVREQNNRIYYRAIHTSYLTDKFATRFVLDKDATKAASYYWRLVEWKKQQLSVDEFKSVGDFLAKYSFPGEAIALIEELMSGHKPVTREAMAVYMSDFVIRLFMDLFEKDKNTKLDYKQFFKLLFKEKFQDGTFDKCDFSIRQLNEMQELFVKEALYYDFLRRE